MSDPGDNAGAQAFADGWYCSEAVLVALAERVGMDPAAAPALATGLCAGMGRTGHTCGALTGAVVALGAASGRRDRDQSVEDTFDLVRALIDGFEAEHGATDCPALLGCDIGTPEGRQAFKTHELKHRCRTFTGTATALATALLDEFDATRG